MKRMSKNVRLDMNKTGAFFFFFFVFVHCSVKTGYCYIQEYCVSAYEAINTKDV